MRLVAQVDVREALQQLDNFRVGLLQRVVVADDGAVARHQLAQLAPQAEGVFRAIR